MRDWYTFGYHLSPPGDSLKTFCIPVSIFAFEGSYHKIFSLSNFFCKFQGISRNYGFDIEAVSTYTKA